MKETIPAYTTQDEKGKLISLKIINTDAQFYSFMESLSKLSAEEKGIWRGLPESKFKLYNSLQRKNLIDRKLNSLQDVVIQVGKCATELEKWNRGLILNFFDENFKLSHVPLYAALSILQHYGCETPLLDWTRNPYVALYFATKRDLPWYKRILQTVSVNQIYSRGRQQMINDYFSIYFITIEHPYYNVTSKTVYDKLKVDDIKEPHIQNKIDYIKNHGGDELLQREAAEAEKNLLIQNEINNPETLKKSILDFPIQRIEDKPEDNFTQYTKINNNINAQRGLFILNAYPYKPLEEAIVDRMFSLVKSKNESFEIAYMNHKKNFICYDIHKKFIPKIIDHLNSKNVTKSTMFPDFKKLRKEICSI